MGSPETEWGRGMNTETQMAVTLTHAFLMQQHETTQREWMTLAPLNPSGKMQDGTGDCLEPDCPVGNVTWFEALAFANLLSQAHNPPLRPCYDLTGCTGELGQPTQCQSVTITAASLYECEGFRLPTEAEWEYAARAGTRTAFYSGDITPQATVVTCGDEPNLDSIAWYCKTAGTSTHKVAQKRPNAWLLFDMLGNINEWVNDDSIGIAHVGPVTDPLGELRLNTTDRVTRGALFNSWSSLLRCASRLGGGWNMSGPGRGFRLVRTLFDSDGG
jgi:formylglycine-generating enzyme required for sulfatase activity